MLLRRLWLLLLLLLKQLLGCQGLWRCRLLLLLLRQMGSNGLRRWLRGCRRRRGCH